MVVGFTADTGSVAGVGRQVESVGHSLRNREEPVDAVLDCPMVPEAAEFLRALSTARQQHCSSLSYLSSFFFDATSALQQFSLDIDEHERHTADSWERWRV